MSAEIAIPAKILSESTVTDLVEDRVYAFPAKQQSRTYPMVVFEVDDADHVRSYKGTGSSNLASQTIRIACIARTVAQRDQLAKAVFDVLDDASGTWGGCQRQGSLLSGSERQHRGGRRGTGRRIPDQGANFPRLVSAQLGGEKMVETFRIESAGLADLKSRLRKLDDNVAKKYLRKSLKEGAKIVQTELVAAAPKRSGRMAKAIRIRSKSRRGLIMQLVTIGKKFFTGETFYGGFVIFGHKIGSRKLSNRKSVPPNRFMERVFDRTKHQAAEAVVQTLKGLIMDEASVK